MPSGDHAAPSSWTALRVSCTGALPSASMTQSSRSPSGFAPRSAVLSKAIRLPSGDHAGPVSCLPGASKSVVSPVPSAFMTWIARSVSPTGETTVVNRMRPRSGDRLG